MRDANSGSSVRAIRQVSPASTTQGFAVSRGAVVFGASHSHPSDDGRPRCARRSSSNSSIRAVLGGRPSSSREQLRRRGQHRPPGLLGAPSTVVAPPVPPVAAGQERPSPPLPPLPLGWLRPHRRRSHPRPPPPVLVGVRRTGRGCRCCLRRNRSRHRRQGRCRRRHRRCGRRRRLAGPVDYRIDQISNPFPNFHLNFI